MFKACKVLRKLAVMALVTSAFSANAGLMTYAPWDVAYSGNGLNGVLFNVQSSGGVTVALGAHAYKNGAFLPNNGTDTFYAQPGLYIPDGLNRANWSFDFAWSVGNCTTCKVYLGIDKDPTALVDYVVGEITLYPVNPESLNMEMAFITTNVYDFNPFGPSSTGFELFITNGGALTDPNNILARSEITVNVPEPGTLALLGLALVGIAGMRRRKV